MKKQWYSDLFGGGSRGGNPPARNASTVLLEAAVQLAVVVGSTYLMTWILKDMLDPNKTARRRAASAQQQLRSRLGRNIDLDEYEQVVCASVINPEHINVDLDDVHGYEEIVTEMRNDVLVQLAAGDIFNTTLLRPAKGVLLYGPPGTGKTMIAKAVARESGCFFINVTVSALLSKWFGDANKFTRAVFTLAQKLQPCIVFIDEIDALLGVRTAHEHEAITAVKTEFMQLWDGIEGFSSARILIMGATNRPYQVDEAVLRRFSLQYEVGLPNENQRFAILHGYLIKHQHEMAASPVVLCSSPRIAAQHDVQQDADSLQTQPIANQTFVAKDLLAKEEPGKKHGVRIIAEQTEGFSGSDLTELCSVACKRPVQSFVLQYRDASDEGAQQSTASCWTSGMLRPVDLDDLKYALSRTQPPLSRMLEYERSTAHMRQVDNIQRSAIDPTAVDLMRMLFQGCNGSTAATTNDNDGDDHQQQNNTDPRTMSSPMLPPRNGKAFNERQT